VVLVSGVPSLHVCTARRVKTPTAKPCLPTTRRWLAVMLQRMQWWQGVTQVERCYGQPVVRCGACLMVFFQYLVLGS
jgi:hypothetical protein